MLTLLMGVLLALIPVAGFPVFRRHDEVLATGYLLFRGALEMIGYAATAFVWLAMAQVAPAPAGPGTSGVINVLARLPDAAINPYVDIVFSLGALMLTAGGSPAPGPGATVRQWSAQGSGSAGAA